MGTVTTSLSNNSNVLLWDAMTSVAPEKGAPTVIGQLAVQTKVTAKSLPLSTLTFESGTAKLIEEMDRKFGCDHITLLYNNVGSFFYFVWEKDMSVEESNVGFHARLDKISKLDTNDELKEHLLLHQAKLESHALYINIGSSRCDYSL